MIGETERLTFRQMEKKDYGALCGILQDAEVMYAYEHAFSDQEVCQWLERQIGRYEKYGFGLWLVILKETGEVIGQCGITMQDTGSREVPEVGYLFKKEFWHQGYALEAALACRDYAFDTLQMTEVYSIIRDSNVPSQRVAERGGMKRCGKIVKHYYQMDMPHYLYRITREEWENISKS